MFVRGPSACTHTATALPFAATAMSALVALAGSFSIGPAVPQPWPNAFSATTTPSVAIDPMTIAGARIMTNLPFSFRTSCAVVGRRSRRSQGSRSRALEWGPSCPARELVTCPDANDRRRDARRVHREAGTRMVRPPPRHERDRTSQQPDRLVACIQANAYRAARPRSATLPVDARYASWCSCATFRVAARYRSSLVQRAARCADEPKIRSLRVHPYERPQPCDQCRWHGAEPMPHSPCAKRCARESVASLADAHRGDA